MIKSPLILNKYDFTRIEFYCKEKPEFIEKDIFGALNVSCSDQSNRDWRVILLVSNNQDETVNKKVNFHYAFEVVGFFSVDPKYDEERIEPLVYANAPAILYGTIREMLLNISLRSPCGRIQLPTVTFIDEFRKNCANKDKKLTTEVQNSKTPVKKKRIKKIKKSSTKQ